MVSVTELNEIGRFGYPGPRAMGNVRRALIGRTITDIEFESDSVTLVTEGKERITIVPSSEMSGGFGSGPACLAYRVKDTHHGED